MKKILIVLAAGIMAFAFAGCGNGQATSQEAVDNLADPWEVVESLSAAEGLAGFELKVPDDINIESDAIYSYCAALNEIEVQFTDPSSGYVRKAKDDGDISGDYEKYKDEKKADVSGVEVTMKGNGDGTYNLAVWHKGDYSYCLGFDEGISELEMKELISGIE